jgi:hypothetical protein
VNGLASISQRLEPRIGIGIEIEVKSKASFFQIRSVESKKKSNRIATDPIGFVF